MSDTLPCDRCEQVFWSGDVASVTLERTEGGTVVETKDTSLCEGCYRIAKRKGYL